MSLVLCQPTSANGSIQFSLTLSAFTTTPQVVARMRGNSSADKAYSLVTWDDETNYANKVELRETTFNDLLGGTVVASWLTDDQSSSAEGTYYVSMAKETIIVKKDNVVIMALNDQYDVYYQVEWDIESSLTHFLGDSWEDACWSLTGSVTSGSGSISPLSTMWVVNKQSPTITFVPNEGYGEAHLTVDGVSLGVVSSYTFSSVSADHTYSVDFPKLQYYISVTRTTDANGSVHGTVSPKSIFADYGSIQTFTFTPDTGYHVSSVVVDGLSVGAPSSYTFTNVTATHTLVVSFAINTYTISVPQNSNGSISPSTTVVSYGGSQTFTITPNSGYRIATLVVDGSSTTTSSSYTFSNVTASHTIVATFAPGSYIVTVTQSTNGTISPSTVSVPFGESQQFTVTPNTGYSITSVTIDGVNQGAISSYTFNSVSSTHTVTADFTLIEFAITASSGSKGSISPQGTVSVGYGGSQSFSFTADEGYKVSDVLVDGYSIGAVASYNFTNVVADHTIVVSYTLQTFTISVSAGTNGHITPSLVTVDYNSSQTFTIVSNSGYYIDSLVVDGLSVTRSDTYTFPNVVSTHTIAATFAALPTSDLDVYLGVPFDLDVLLRVGSDLDVHLLEPFSAGVKVYTGDPTAGGVDGTLVQLGSPITAETLTIQASEVDSTSIKCAVRVDPGLENLGDITLSLRGTHSNRWRLASDSGSGPNSSGSWGSSLLLLGPFGNTNTIFWVQTRALPGEVLPGGMANYTDTTVSLRVTSSPRVKGHPFELDVHLTVAPSFSEQPTLKEGTQTSQGFTYTYGVDNPSSLDLTHEMTLSSTSLMEEPSYSIVEEGPQGVPGYRYFNPDTHLWEYTEDGLISGPWNVGIKVKGLAFVVESDVVPLSTSTLTLTKPLLSLRDSQIVADWPDAIGKPDDYEIERMVVTSEIWGTLYTASLEGTTLDPVFAVQSGSVTMNTSHQIVASGVGAFASFSNQDFTDITYEDAGVSIDYVSGNPTLIARSNNGNGIYGWSAYVLTIGPTTGMDVYTSALGVLSSSILHVDTIPVSGDSITLKAVGTTISILQNGIELGSVVDTTYSNGVFGFGCASFDSTLSGVSIEGLGIFTTPWTTLLTTSTPGFTDSGLFYHYTYSYRVRAYDSVGNTTPWSDSVSGVPLPPAFNETITASLGEFSINTLPLELTSTDNGETLVASLSDLSIVTTDVTPPHVETNETLTANLSNLTVNVTPLTLIGAPISETLTASLSSLTITPTAVTRVDVSASGSGTETLTASLSGLTITVSAA